MCTKTIHPPDRWGASRCWLNMINRNMIAQMCSGLIPIQNHFQQGERALGTRFRADACELNLHFTILNCLQYNFWEYSSASNWPYDQRTRVTASSQISTSGFFSCKILWDRPPGQLIQQLVCKTKEFLHRNSACCFSLYRANGSQRARCHVGGSSLLMSALWTDRPWVAVVLW